MNLCSSKHVCVGVCTHGKSLPLPTGGKNTCRCISTQALSPHNHQISTPLVRLQERRSCQKSGTRRAPASRAGAEYYRELSTLTSLAPWRFDAPMRGRPCPCRTCRARKGRRVMRHDHAMHCNNTLQHTAAVHCCSCVTVSLSFTFASTHRVRKPHAPYEWVYHPR